MKTCPNCGERITKDNILIKKKCEKCTYTVSKFYKMAETYRKNMTDESEIEKIDVTNEFMQELDDMIRKGEIVIININAKMRLGKSTLGIGIGYHIFERLKFYNFRRDSEKFGMKNIARDQQEKSKMMRDPDLQNTVIVTDENNELEKGGENATAEEQLNRVFSDVQAGRYVHSVSCSPKEIIDPNADILLSVISINKKNRSTRCKLYYRYNEGNMEYIQLLGIVDFEVGHIINNWEDEVKTHFFKMKPEIEEGESTKSFNERMKDYVKSKGIVAKYSKEDFFVEYTVKKYEKMDLITRHGIFRPRLLDYSEVILNVVEKLKSLTKMSSLINNRIVKNYVKSQFTMEKIPTSLVGIQVATDEALGILEMYKSLNQLNKKLEMFDNIKNNPKNEKELYQAESNYEELLPMIETVRIAIAEQISELKKYRDINNIYNKRLS